MGSLTKKLSFIWQQKVMHSGKNYIDSHWYNIGYIYLKISFAQNCSERQLKRIKRHLGLRRRNNLNIETAVNAIQVG